MLYFLYVRQETFSWWILTVGLEASLAKWNEVFGETLESRIKREGIENWLSVKQEDLQKEALQLASFFDKNYGITINTPSSIEIITGKGANNKPVSFILNKISESWTIILALRELKKIVSLFPPKKLNQFIKSINLVGVIETDDKKKQFGFVAGLANTKPFELSLRIEEIISNNSSRKIQAILHAQPIVHEITHMILRSNEHTWYSNFLKEIYGSEISEKDIYDDEIFLKTTRANSGFATVYGQSNVLEDVAEVAAHAFCPTKEFADRLKSDIVLRKKFMLIQNELSSRLDLTKDYWIQLYEGKIDYSYWKN